VKAIPPAPPAEITRVATTPASVSSTLGSHVSRSARGWYAVGEEHVAAERERLEPGRHEQPQEVAALDPSEQLLQLAVMRDKQRDPDRDESAQRRAA
jgi:hypothetical protein